MLLILAGYLLLASEFLIDSAVLIAANPIQVEQRVIFFAFPWMVGVVGLMLFLARLSHTLQRWKGYALISIYFIYITISIIRFYG